VTGAGAIFGHAIKNMKAGGEGDISEINSEQRRRGVRLTFCAMSEANGEVACSWGVDRQWRQWRWCVLVMTGALAVLAVGMGAVSVVQQPA
jgi:hypothetical protein